MFEFFNKKRKSPSKPKGNKDEAEKPEAPDAETAVDNIDAALAEADRIRDNEAFDARRRMLEETSRGCGCGGR